MDIYDNNINVLTSYIADGSKGCNSNAVGVELEHFVIDKNGDCVPYINGVENISNACAKLLQTRLQRRFSYRSFV